MQLRFINIYSIAFVALAFSGARPVAAAKPSGEIPGCHLDADTESFQCESGPLAGREFVTKEEAAEALEEMRQREKERAAEIVDTTPPPLPEEKPAVEQTPVPEDHLLALSWNMRGLREEGSDYDRAALIMAPADLIILQEIDLKNQGKGFINVLANLIQQKSNEKVCRAWVQAASGERLTYAFLWKEKSIGFLDGEGEIKDTCGDSAVTIRQENKTKLVSQGTFFFKRQKKMFIAASMFSESKPKAADKFVSEIFRTVNGEKFPVVVAGDVKMGAGNPAFAAAKKMGFQPAMTGRQKAWDNFWFRGATIIKAAPVDFQAKFPDVKRKTLEKDFGGVRPILAELSLKEKVTDSISLIKKKKNKR